MNSGFWTINVGQVLTALGLVASALVFIWKTASLHGQQKEKFEDLAGKVESQERTSKEHGVVIVELARLAAISEKRLELIEQELRDNRNQKQEASRI